jgi:hypothetical protein
MISIQPHAAYPSYAATQSVAAPKTQSFQGYHNRRPPMDESFQAIHDQVTKFQAANQPENPWNWTKGWDWGTWNSIHKSLEANNPFEALDGFLRLGPNNFKKSKEMILELAALAVKDPLNSSSRDKESFSFGASHKLRGKDTAFANQLLQIFEADPEMKEQFRQAFYYSI